MSLNFFVTYVLDTYNAQVSRSAFGGLPCASRKEGVLENSLRLDIVRCQALMPGTLLYHVLALFPFLSPMLGGVTWGPCPPMGGSMIPHSMQVEHLFKRE